MKSKDHELWELNRMKVGGVIKQDGSDWNEVQVQSEQNEEERVALIVHDIKPPFLDGRIVFTK